MGRGATSERSWRTAGPFSSRSTRELEIVASHVCPLADTCTPALYRAPLLFLYTSRFLSYLSI